MSSQLLTVTYNQFLTRHTVKCWKGDWNETADSSVWDGCSLFSVIVLLCVMMWSHVVIKYKLVKAHFVFLYITFPPSHMIWLAFTHFIMSEMWFCGQIDIKPQFPVSGFQKLYWVYCQCLTNTLSYNLGQTIFYTNRLAVMNSGIII